MLGEKLRQFRVARGLSLAELAAELGGVVTRQSLWKYEKGLAQPSAVVLMRLAAVLGVRASRLLEEPVVTVRFVAYRKGSGLPKRDEQQVESMVGLALEERVRLRDKVGLVGTPDLPVEGIQIASVDDAEDAARHMRDLWNLGHDAIANLIAVLEDHDVYVVELDANEKFDGISAFAEDEAGAVVGAAVVARKGVPGERQRLDLAHELGHLVLQVAQDVDEEKAAFRFGGAFLAPASVLYSEVGRKRSFVQLAELRLMKRRYGMSLQALVHRLHDLEIINDSHYRQWWLDFNRLGYRKNEPDPIPAERPEWLRRIVLRSLAEGLLAKDEAERLTGETIEVDVPLTLVERRALLKLPLEDRRRSLAEQADRISAHYDQDQEWRKGGEGEVVEY